MYKPKTGTDRLESWLILFYLNQYFDCVTRSYQPRALLQSSLTLCCEPGLSGGFRRLLPLFRFSPDLDPFREMSFAEATGLGKGLCDLLMLFVV